MELLPVQPLAQPVPAGATQCASCGRAAPAGVAEARFCCFCGRRYDSEEGGGRIGATVPQAWVQVKGGGGAGVRTPAAAEAAPTPATEAGGGGADPLAETMAALGGAQPKHEAVFAATLQVHKLKTAATQPALTSNVDLGDSLGRSTAGDALDSSLLNRSADSPADGVPRSPSGAMSTGMRKGARVQFDPKTRVPRRRASTMSLTASLRNPSPPGTRGAVPIPVGLQRTGAHATSSAGISSPTPGSPRGGTGRRLSAPGHAARASPVMLRHTRDASGSFFDRVDAGSLSESGISRSPHRVTRRSGPHLDTILAVDSPSSAHDASLRRVPSTLTGATTLGTPLVRPVSHTPQGFRWDQRRAGMHSGFSSTEPSVYRTTSRMISGDIYSLRSHHQTLRTPDTPLSKALSKDEASVHAARQALASPTARPRQDPDSRSQAATTVLLGRTDTDEDYVPGEVWGELAALDLGAESLQLRTQPGERFRIGRGAECHCRLKGSGVSRIHCALTFVSPAEVVLEDCSANGVGVNGQRIVGRISMLHGDRLELPYGKPVGRYVFCFVHLTRRSLETSANSPPRWLRSPHVLGSGGFGKVFLGMNERSGELIAIKQVVFDDQAKVEALKREIETLNELNHPRIVKYYGSEQRKGGLNILMEYVPHGSLFDHLHRVQRALPACSVRVYVVQILSALEYIHQCKIIHRDLKSANVLMAHERNQVCIKLTDFGCACTTGEARGLAGSLMWMAPEAFREQSCTASDVWSLGCLVLEAVLGTPGSPYPAGTFNEFSLCTVGFQVVLRGVCPTVPDTLPQVAQDFLRSCVAHAAHDRPSASQLLAHAWIRTAPPTPPREGDERTDSPASCATEEDELDFSPRFDPARSGCLQCPACGAGLCLTQLHNGAPGSSVAVSPPPRSPTGPCSPTEPTHSQRSLAWGSRADPAASDTVDEGSKHGSC